MRRICIESLVNAVTKIKHNIYLSLWSLISVTHCMKPICKPMKIPSAQTKQNYSNGNYYTNFTGRFLTSCLSQIFFDSNINRPVGGIGVI